MGKRGPIAKNRLPVAKASTMEVASPNKPSKADVDRQRRYMAEDALRDIERAEIHKGNKDLMSDVKQLAKEKMEALKRIK